MFFGSNQRTWLYVLCSSLNKNATLKLKPAHFTCRNGVNELASLALPLLRLKLFCLSIDSWVLKIVHATIFWAQQVSKLVIQHSVLRFRKSCLLRGWPPGLLAYSRCTVTSSQAILQSKLPSGRKAVWILRRVKELLWGSWRSLWWERGSTAKCAHPSSNLTITMVCIVIWLLLVEFILLVFYVFLNEFLVETLSRFIHIITSFYCTYSLVVYWLF